MLFLDTHALVWLYQGDRQLFSERAQLEVEQSELVIAPIVLLELQYLYESKKIKVKPEEIFSELQKSIGVRVAQSDGEMVATAAMKLAWTRDPFDRLIVAQAHCQKALLLTKDREILRHYAKAVW